MRVIYDGVFYYSPRTTIKAACHLKILTGSSTTLIITTEIQGNQGWSIARSPELLATQVIQMFQLNPDQTKYIEHYLPYTPSPDSISALVKIVEAYFLVTFTWQIDNPSQVYTANDPHRKPISVVEFVRLMRVLYTEQQI